MSKYVNEIVEAPTDPAGGASGVKRYFTVRFLGKSDNAAFPFTIANEIVATFIGQSLGLNLPSALTYEIGGTPLVFIQMLDRDPMMSSAAPVTSQVLREYVETHPDEVHAAILFDLFVSNNDRAFGPERRNLALDDRRRLFLFDHGNACYYRNRPDAGITSGIPRLNAIEAELPAMFDMSDKGNHYLEFLTDWELVEKWCERIRQLPDYLIEAAVTRIPDFVPRPTLVEKRRLVDFLMARPQYLLEHIVRWREPWFPNLPPRASHA